MSPLSPLRAILLGALSWLVLGLGVYCLWVAYERSFANESLASMDSDTLVESDYAQDLTQSNDLERRSEVTNPNQRLINDEPTKEERPIWPYLLTGTLLTIWSFAGGWPVAYLLSSGSDPIPFPEGTKTFVDSPSGARLAIEIFGSDSAPTLLLTHGWSLDRTVWGYAIDKFRDRYRIVTWDLPGLGDSTAPANKQYSMDRFAADLRSVLGSIDNGRPVILVGHSIGGMTQQTLLKQLQAQASCKGVAFVATTYTDPLKTMLGSSLWVPLKYPLIKPLNKLAIVLGPLLYVANWQSYLNGTLHMTTRFTSFTGRQSYQQLDYASRLAAKAWPPHIARGNLAAIEFDGQSDANSYSQPTVVVAGRNDRITKPEAGERLSHLLKRSALHSVDGGHLCFWEFHKEVNEALAKFVSQVHSDTSQVHESRNVG